MGINRYLLQQAETVILEKRGFVPPPDPSQMGAPPGGSPPPGSAPPGGAAPPGAGPPPIPGGPPPGPGAPPMGGPPPMDPSQMGAPPPDPSQGGGDPNAQAPPPDIRQIIQEEIQKALAANGGAAGAGGAGKVPGKKKVEPERIIEYMHRHEKLLTELYKSLGMPLPYDILEPPPEDGSAPGEAGAAGQPPADPNAAMAGGAGAVNPTGIQPISPVAPQQKAAAAPSVVERAEAMSILLATMRSGR